MYLKYFKKNAEGHIFSSNVIVIWPVMKIIAFNQWLLKNFFSMSLFVKNFWIHIISHINFFYVNVCMIWWLVSEILSLTHFITNFLTAVYCRDFSVAWQIFLSTPLSVSFFTVTAGKISINWRQFEKKRCLSWNQWVILALQGEYASKN